MAKHIYVHIPFCARKCPYCDFYSTECFNAYDEAKYFASLQDDIRNAKIVPDVNFNDEIDTVYFGGGTPSVVNSEHICKTLKLIREHFDIRDQSEITIEANPASSSLQKFMDYRNAGFNRISIGVQSLHDETLGTLGRLHDSKTAIATLKAAFEAGFTNVSADLILGVPGQTKDELLDDARKLLDIGVTHVSMYSLIIEEGTKFYDRYRYIDDHVDPDLERDMYHSLRDLLKANGLEPYEISNCGRMSIHNMCYWRGMEYYAFGASASGYLEGRRFTNSRSFSDYEANVEEVLDPISKSREYAMLMMRTTEGVSKKEFRDRFEKDLDAEFKEEIASLMARGLVEDSGDRVFLTRKGLDFANLVFEEFV